MSDKCSKALLTVFLNILKGVLYLKKIESYFSRQFKIRNRSRTTVEANMLFIRCKLYQKGILIIQRRGPRFIHIITYNTFFNTIGQEEAAGYYPVAFFPIGLPGIRHGRFPGNSLFSRYTFSGYIQTITPIQSSENFSSLVPGQNCLPCKITGKIAPTTSDRDKVISFSEEKNPGILSISRGFLWF